MSGFLDPTLCNKSVTVKFANGDFYRFHCQEKVGHEGVCRHTSELEPRNLGSMSYQMKHRKFDLLGRNADPNSAKKSLSAVDTYVYPEDELLPEAIAAVRKAGKGSTAVLQKQLRIGFGRSAQLLNIMSQRGILGPERPGAYREVLAP